jgi:hypothetical protein
VESFQRGTDHLRYSYISHADMIIVIFLREHLKKADSPAAGELQVLIHGRRNLDNLCRLQAFQRLILDREDALDSSVVRFDPFGLHKCSVD